MKQKIRRFLLFMTMAFVIVVSTSLSQVNAATKSGLGKEVERAIEKGILQGDHEGNYHVGREVTRKEFAALLSRMLELEDDATVQFNDVAANHSLGQHIRAVAKAGYMKGTKEGDFRPEAKVTREQIAVIASNVLKDYDLTERSTIRLVDEDEQYMIAVGKESVLHAYEYGVVKGFWLSADGKAMKYEPKQSATRGQAAAILLRLNDQVKEESTGSETEEPDQEVQGPEEKPAPPVEEKPAPSKPYTLGYMEGNKMVSKGTGYATYNEALKAMNDSKEPKAIMKDQKVVGVKYGFITAPANAYTLRVYATKELEKKERHFTYVMSGQELPIIENGEKVMKVRIGNRIGYVNPSGMIIRSYDEVSQRDRYFVDANGQLKHYPINHNHNQPSAYSYVVGEAGATMPRNATYLSTDGVHFTHAQTGKVYTHYPYFQFQSIRTATSYTAEQLDLVIQQSLRERAALNQKKYEGIMEKSKLNGLGKTLKEVEAKHRVNALFILATAIHESDYGMSANAQQKNNLFGIRVFDSQTDAGSKYKEPKSSVQAFIDEYMNKNYGLPNVIYGFGAVPGNKVMGANVMYASDAHWGAKIASHMKQLDAKLGNQDYGRYTLGVIPVRKQVNVRTDIGTTSPVLFTYDKGVAKKVSVSLDTYYYPVAIVEEKRHTDGYVWYKILVDDMIKVDERYVQHGWVRSDLVDIIYKK